MEMRNGKTDKMPMNRVILMTCGRYNPPTYMHLRMFERARDHLHTLRVHTVVGGVISLVNDSANHDLAKSTVRYDLLKLALQNSDWIRLSSWQLQQNIFKNVQETLHHHQNVLNSFISNNIDNNTNLEDTEWIPNSIKNKSDTSPIKIKLLCGVELLESLSIPGAWTDEDLLEIVDKYGLVVIGKEGGNPYKCIYNSDILSKYMHNIHIVTEWIPNEVNSTRIRTALRRGESVKYLLQDAITKFIYKHGIYDAKRLTIPVEARTGTMDSSRTPGEMAATATTTTSGRVVLMSCGSYNPPTHMHLRMFERARDHLHNLGTHLVVGGVISPVNDAYSKKELASGIHRCEMLKLALEDSDWIRLSTWELRQTCWTRTRKSLQHHQSLLNALISGEGDDNRNEIDSEEDLDWIPESIRNNDSADMTPIQIKLLCGGDLLESFATPGLWAEEDIAEIVSKYGLIVITREGSNPYKFIYDSDVLSKHLHNIQIVTEWIPNEVSSSRIRRALKRGESVKYLLQDAVIDYVYSNGIYGANRSSTIKLELSSNYSSNDYLNTDEAKYNNDNAFLTPSPSDVAMQETSPCNDYAATVTKVVSSSIITNKIFNSMLQKNLQNNCNSPHYSDDHSSVNSIEDTELARKKFFRSIVNNFGDETSSSLVLLQQNDHIFSQIDSQIVLPSSARARNELLAFEGTTESQLTPFCNNTYNDEREDVLSITYEENSEDLNESSIKNDVDHKLDRSFDKTYSENLTSTNKSVLENSADLDSQSTSFGAHYEIDGKYLKSLVNSKKSSKKNDDDESVKSSNSEELKLAITDDSSKNVILDEIVKEVKYPKLFEDISYIKRLRLIINNKPSDNSKKERHQLQGSLDSINLKESNSTVRVGIDSMTKKSKSFESIKRIVPMSCKSTEISYCDSTSKVKSDSTSQLITAPEFNAQSEDFCAACCFDTSVEQPSTTDVFYTIRSNCSSPDNEDSTECDICSSINLQDSNDTLDCKSLITTVSNINETTEICEICGEPAMGTDELLVDNSKLLITRSRSIPLTLPKAKSTIEISKGLYRMSTLDDDRFEIDNCGLQDCKLRSSLNVCNKPEPLYMNLIPGQFQLNNISRQSSNKNKSDELFTESYCRVQEPMYIQSRKDDMLMSRSLSISGSGKRLSRKGSSVKKSTIDRTQEKRRYSSVDNLQNRMSFRNNGEKLSKSRDTKFMTSADSIRPPRTGRSRSLRRSADNVRRFDSSGDNLDSLEENVDVDENVAIINGNNVENKCVTAKLRDSDTIKMILTKHGIKIISQKETVL